MQSNLLNAITQALSKAGIVAGTTSTYTTTVATAGTIEGKFATALAAQTNTATPTTDANGDAFTALAASQGCVFVVGTTLAGAIAVVQGGVEALDTEDGSFVVAPSFPDIPSDFMPFAYVIIKAGSTASAWTFGASNWTATGIIDTFVDIGTMPDRPQES